MLYILALGTVPVPAAVVTRTGMATAVTGKGMASHFRGPAVQDIIICPRLVRAKPSPGQEVFLLGFQDIRKLRSGVPFVGRFHHSSSRGLLICEGSKLLTWR